MSTYLFAYFGPETALPLVSGIVAIAGFVMVMGRNGVYFLGRKVRGLFRRPGRGKRTPGARAIVRGPGRTPDEPRPVGEQAG